MRSWSTRRRGHRGSAQEPDQPWPDGAILGKVVWKATRDKHWDKATVTGALVHAEFMTEDKAKNAATGRWGHARSTGTDQPPHGNDMDFAGECVRCHTPVKGQDWLCTRPAMPPSVRRARARE